MIKRLAPWGWLAFAVLLVLVVSKIDYAVALEAENDRLKKAWSARQAAQPSFSCAVADGQRLLCWRESDQVHSVLLQPGDQIMHVKRRKR